MRALVLIWWSLVMGMGLWGVAGRAGAEGPVVAVAEVGGVIDPINAQYLARVLRQAEGAGADLLVIELNTPGGLATAMESMVQTMLAAKLPTAVYVTPTGARAGSAGVFVAMAADVVAMAPGTVIGAAHPVSLGGEQASQAVEDKSTNYAAAYARSVATAKGHNADWAEQAVRASATATEQEALREGIADIVARDWQELLQRLEGRRVKTAAGERMLPALAGASIQRWPLNPAEAALHVIADPNIALLLLSVGSLGILAEFYHPGALFPGITGVISLLVGFVALGQLPTNWGAAALLGLAVLLVVLELHLPSHGLLAVGSAVAFVLGGLLLFAPLTPEAPVFTAFEVNRWLLVGMAGALSSFALVVLRTALRTRSLPVGDPRLGLVGTRGRATSRLAPEGTVLALNEEWSAVAQGESIGAGETVEVVAREGLRLRVRRVEGRERVKGTGEGEG